MVVFEINRQADALYGLINAFESDYTKIAYKAIIDWSKDGHESSNIEKFNKFEVFGLSQLLKLHCDWTMVKFEYDRQVKARNAF